MQDSLLTKKYLYIVFAYETQSKKDDYFKTLWAFNAYLINCPFLFLFLNPYQNLMKP